MRDYKITFPKVVIGVFLSSLLLFSQLGQLPQKLRDGEANAKLAQVHPGDYGPYGKIDHRAVADLALSAALASCHRSYDGPSQHTQTLLALCLSSTEDAANKYLAEHSH